MKQRQTKLTEFIRDSRAGNSSDSSDADDSVYADNQKGVIYWSRIKSREQMAATKIVVFDLNEDLNDKRSLHVKGPDPIEEHKIFLFDPYDFDGKN